MGLVLCSFCFLAAFVYSGIPSLSAPPPHHHPVTPSPCHQSAKSGLQREMVVHGQGFIYTELEIYGVVSDEVVFYQGGLSLGWSLIRVIFH